MKFIHLSDLHIGKRVNEFSMIEDQEYILKQILNIIDGEAPDGVIIAGDVYDKPVPSAEAVELFDDFIVRLSKRDLPVYIISGNHDSPERLAFGNRLMASSGIHFSSVYNGAAERFELTDEYGTTAIYMLPFVKPSHVRRFYPDDKIESYTDAIVVAVREMHINQDDRNIIITHQFVTGAERSDSEELSVGGTDNVDASAFEGFDYVALGHIHRPQNVGNDTIRYCGSPLKYSFSEAPYEKSVTVVELKEKGNTSVYTVPLTPMRDMVELKGTYDELTLKSFYEGTSYREDYVHITLTDEEDIPDVVQKLRVIYRNLMKLDYDNKRTRNQTEINGAEMSDEQAKYMEALIEKIWEEQA